MCPPPTDRKSTRLRYNALLPVGRVQTPTLNLIVQRDLEIERFVPTPYHEIRASFGDYEGLYFDPEKKELRCYDPDRAAAIKRQCTGKPATVTDSKCERKKTPPPQLFDLTSLQRDANRLMGASAAKTLEMAQALYEQHKLITYPRTDSRYLPKDMLPQIKKTLAALPEPYKQLAANPLDTPIGRVINDAKVSDHHAIIPTGQSANLARLSPDERKLFDMIARRFIAVHYPDYEYESVQIKTSVEGHSFHTGGTTPLIMGWRALYTHEENEDDKKTEKQIPRLSVGDRRTCESIALKKQQTKPPAPHNDATLLQLMENAGKTIADEALQEAMKDSGLGTPATRAAIIERLIQVKYVQRKGKILQSTDKGRKLIAIAPEEIRSAETTGRWERALHAMAGEKNRDALARRTDNFMHSIRRYTTFLVDFAKTSAAAVEFPREESRGGKKGAPAVKMLGAACPICGQGEVSMTSKAFGCSRYREGCKYTVWLDCLVRAGGPKLNMTIMKKLLKGGKVPAEGGTMELRDGFPRWQRD